VEDFKMLDIYFCYILFDINWSKWHLQDTVYKICQVHLLSNGIHRVSILKCLNSKLETLMTIDPIICKQIQQ
jgi:hypothetical protein